MIRSRLEKDPDLVCGFTWGGTPDIDEWDNGYECPHFCHLKVADHGDVHVCCGETLNVEEEE